MRRISQQQGHQQSHKQTGKPSIDDLKPKHDRKAAHHVKRQFGDHRFDYITSMKHDLRIDNCSHYTKASIAAAQGTSRGHCPMCMLINSATAVFYTEEAARREKEREDSVRRGIEMRVTLLHRWARNQASILHSAPGSPPVVEVAFCGKIGAAIAAFKEMPTSEEMRNLLALRNRISEVGHFAALYLQTRIRKYCCKRRLRRYLLRRFEFTPAEGFRGDSYFDSARGKRLYRPPVLLKNERSNTPRTIQRRLNAEEKKRKLRYERYENNLRRGAEGYIDLWAEQTKTVHTLSILKE